MEAGIDEAGRGPVIGPMVVAIVSTNDQSKLERIEVKDSKKLSPHRRTQLFRQILTMASCVKSIIVPPDEIDRYVMVNGLNDLEMSKMIELISMCEADTIYVDSPDPRPERFGQRLEEATGRRVIAMNKADAIIPVVSAASIIAKVTRDNEIAKLRREYGDFGSGYPSDPRTIDFLKKWIKQHGSLPPIVRRTWKTIDDIKG